MFKNGLVIGSVLLVLLSVLGVTPTASAASICGFKFNDKANDKSFDGNEETLDGWTINLDGWESFGTAFKPVRASTKTIEGEYCFDGLNPGTYRVFETLPNVLLIPKEVQVPSVPPASVVIPEPVVWVPTTPPGGSKWVTITPSMKGDIIRVNFGNRLLPIPCISATC